jgi:MFS family permease
MLFLGQALGSIGGALIFGFLPLYARARFGAGVALAALTPAVYFLAAAAASLVAGELADRYGRRSVIVAGFLLGGAAALALALAPTLPLMLGAAGAAGFFDSLLYPAVQAIVADTVPKESRAVVFGRMYQALGVGWFLGPAAAGLLIGPLGFAPLYGSAAAILVATGLVLASRLPETKPSSTVSVERSGNALAHASFIEAAAPVPWSVIAAPAADLAPPAPSASPHAPAAVTDVWYRDRRLLVYVGLYILTSGAYMQLFTVFPAEGLSRNHLAVGSWGAALALNGAMILGAQRFVSQHIRGMEASLATAAGIGLWVVGFAGLAALDGPAWVFLAMVVLTAGEMVVFPLQPALVADLAPPSNRARYQGALALGGSMGNAVGPALAGVAVAAIGATWWLILAALLIGLAAAYVATGRQLRPP